MGYFCRTALEILFTQLYKELSVHAQAEELTFYPTMGNHQSTNALVDQGEREYTEVKVLLEQLKALDTTSSEFKAKISELKDAIQHHVQEEENKIFPKVQECISEEELKQLATEFQQAQSKLQDEIAVASR